MWGEIGVAILARRARCRNSFQNACLVKALPRRDTNSARDDRPFKIAGRT